MIMHFTGTVYRNPYWPTFPLLEITQEPTLDRIKKGYHASDIIEQCSKLHEAGIDFWMTFLNGTAGKEHSRDHAINSAILSVNASLCWSAQAILPNPTRFIGKMILQIICLDFFDT